MNYELAQKAYSLRQHWPNISVLEASFGNFIWRPLILREFDAATAMAATYPAPWINDFLVQSAMLYSAPDLEYFLSNGPGGVIDQLAELILQGSGFATQDFSGDVKKARQDLQKIHNTMQAFVLKAFPQLGDLRSLTYPQLLEWFTRAEGVLGQVPLEGEKPKKRRGLRKASKEELIQKYPDILSEEVAEKFVP